MIYTAALSSPWHLAFPSGVAHFHFVVEGSVTVVSTDFAPLVVKAGTLILLPTGRGHRLQDTAIGSGDTQTPPVDPFAVERFDMDRLALEHGGEGETTRLVSGTFHFDDNSSRIVTGALPPFITVSRHDSSNAPWLEALVHFLLAEAQLPAPGSGIMISRLIDVMVVQTLRSWAASHPREGRGWMGGIGDPGIERALTALHDAPMKDWSMNELAKTAAMSRSVFAERFSEKVGEPPLRYLQHWRLSLAADMLRSGTMKVGEVARRVGYDSDASFSRAYKARFGHSPNAARAGKETA
jgi:AraC-like DNA-binding protein